MTLRDLIELSGRQPLALTAFFVVPPLAAWLAGLVHGRDQGRRAPWKYGYSALVYLTCVPGLFAAVITAYSLFFRNENLLDVNLLVYFLPLASMIATLILIRRNVSFNDVPGFDRLSGLMIMIGGSFAIALAIQKTNIFVFFGGSIERLFVLALFVFALIKWGTHLLFRRRDEVKLPRPTLPAP
jgi:hypothetical protein